MTTNGERANFHHAILACLVSLLMVPAAFAQDSVEVERASRLCDLVVHGDSSGAVIAALAAKREGRSVILVNPDRFLGGMSNSAIAAGLAIDEGVNVQEVEYPQLRQKLVTRKIIQQDSAARSVLELAGTVIDDEAASKSGHWESSTWRAGFVGNAYVHDGNKGKGDSFIRYETKLPKSGRYELRMPYTAHTNRATNVPVTVHHAGVSSTMIVNQRQVPDLEDGFHKLGTFSFGGDKSVIVEIGTAGTDGYVIADAIQFVPVREGSLAAGDQDRDVAVVADPSLKPVSDQSSKPNLLFILADDLGIECLSSYGGKDHSTPNIDQLAKQGMQFTQCFSNPFCSPSRASLLTGRYPFRNGLKEVLWAKHQEKIFLSPDQPSFARQLKTEGYATAIAGKWHVSLLHKNNTISEFGFDQYQVWQIFDEQGNKTRRFWKPHLNRNGSILTKEVEDRYGPDVDVEFLQEFIRANSGQKRPFLAYFSTCLPHFPWEPTPDTVDQSYRKPHNEHKGKPEYFPDMLKYLDKCIGRLLQTLEDEGISDNTVVIFLADNGTDRDLKNPWGDGHLLNGGKGTMTDRGTHVPLIVRWPGRIKAGSGCDDLIDFSDFLPTICELTGAALPSEEIHGRSFLPQLLGKRGKPRDWVHVQHGEARHVRDRHYILDNQNRLRPVVEIWEEPAQPDQNRFPEKEQAARRRLEAVFEAFGE